MTSKKSKVKTQDVPIWLWLFLPLFFWKTPYTLRFFNEDWYKLLVRGEMGMIENGTLLFLLVTVVVSLILFFKLKDFKFQVLRWWMLVFALGAFYFAGEEASWGQHFIGWATPDSWLNFVDNTQFETNIHNTGNKFVKNLVNEGPRFMLGAMALIGGIVTPILVKFDKIKWTAKDLWYWLFPTYVCMPSAILAIAVDLPIRIIFWQKYMETKSVGLPTPEFFKTHTSESKECFLACFLMVYVCSILVRYLASKKK